MRKKKGVGLHSIVSYLNRELKIEDIEDSSNNGLQVQNGGSVTRIACGVDASIEFFEAAKRRGADLLIVHHGISWKDSMKRITHLNYKWIRFLVENDMALYGAHLPLDLHPKCGNNALISRALGLKNVRPFGEYHGSRIAVVGSIPGGMPYNAFRKRAEKAMGRKLKEMHFGPETVRKVAVVSGGGCSLIPEAAEIGADMFFSGEPTLSGRNFLYDAGMNGLFGGHYVTERFGVEEVGRLLSKRFGVPAEFVDLEIED